MRIGFAAVCSLGLAMTGCGPQTSFPEACADNCQKVLACETQEAFDRCQEHCTERTAFFQRFGMDERVSDCNAAEVRLLECTARASCAERDDVTQFGVPTVCSGRGEDLREKNCGVAPHPVP